MCNCRRARRSAPAAITAALSYDVFDADGKKVDTVRSLVSASAHARRIGGSTRPAR